MKNKDDDVVLGLENLFYSIQNKTVLLSTGSDGFTSLESIIAMRQSANKNGKRVNLPIKSNNFKILSR